MNTRKPNKQNLIWFSVFAIVIIAGILVGTLLSGKEQGYRTITVFETEGSVCVVNNGIEYQAYPGMVLQEGYAVVTSANSYVRMVLDGDKYVKLEQGSRATFETLGVLGSGKTKIRLERGTLTSEIVSPLKAEEEFVVNTTNAVLAVRGTFFRVALQGETNGKIRTDVYTYGGKVASKRILPTGDVVEEEVLIDAGYKASVSMNEADTVYLTENVVTDEKEEKSITPIVIEEISDEDLVDMYFASDNGHELFVTMTEIEKLVEDRAIVIEEYTPPYEKAKESKEDVIATTPDDNRPLVETETETEEEPEQIAGVPSDGGSDENGETEKTIDVAVNDGIEEGETPNEVQPEEPTEEEEAQVQPDIQEPQEPESQEPEEVPETPEDTGGADSGNTGETPTPEHVHTEVTNTVAATCEQAGMTTVSCSSCGAVLSETEIPATGHTMRLVGTVDVHETCDVCGISNAGHTYMDVTIESTCTTEGQTEYTCNCGYSYIDTIPMLAHTEATEYTDGTDTADGLMRVYCSVCNDTIEEVTLLSIPKNFPDDVFAAYVTSNFDADGHNSLNTEELAALQAATEVNLAGSSSADGGVTSLTGISNFTSLTTLNCAYNTGITSLNLSANAELATLNVDGCSSLTTLDVSGTALTDLILNSNTAIERVTAKSTSSLETVECTGISTLAEVDVTGSTGLKTLNVSGCAGVTVVTTTNCTALEEIDISSCSQMVMLTTSSNPALKKLNFSNCNNIQRIDLTSNANLTHLWASAGNMSDGDLDLTGNPELLVFSLSGSSFTSYDFSQNTKLEELYLSNNQAMVDLYITSNTNLKTLDISNCISLGWIWTGGRYASMTELEAGLVSLDTTGCSSYITVQ